VDFPQLAACQTFPSPFWACSLLSSLSFGAERESTSKQTLKLHRTEVREEQQQQEGHSLTLSSSKEEVNEPPIGHRSSRAVRHVVSLVVDISLSRP